MNNKSYKRLFALQGLIYIAFLAQIVGVPIPQVGILLFAMVVPFFLSQDEIAAYMVGFSMLGTGIQVAYIALVCSVVLLLRNRFQLKKVQLIIPGALICYEILHMIFYQDDSFIELTRYICVYFLLIYILFSDKRQSEKLLIVHSYIYATVFAVVHVFFQSYQALNGNIIRFLNGSLRFGYSEQIGINLTFSADPNLIAQSCSIAIAFCLGLILMGRINWKYFAATLICTLAGMLTVSKTFLISLGMIVILYVLFTGSLANKQAMWKRFFLIVIIVIAICFVYKVYPSYLDNISSRIIAGDITNGRTRIILRYLEYLFNHVGALIFGVGIQNLGDKIYNGVSPHAAMMEVFASWGMMGIIVTVKVIIDSIKFHVEKNKPKLINYIPFLVFSVLVQSTQLFRLRDRIFGLVAVIVFIGFNQQELLEEQEDHDLEKSITGN